MKTIALHEGEMMNMKKMVRKLVCVAVLMSLLRRIESKLEAFSNLPLSSHQLIKYQATCNETEVINEKLKQTERELADIRKEANNYQNMLQQSQTQYATLERKYSKVKKMLREFQQRDRDMVRIRVDFQASSG
jgi:neurabin